MRRQVVAKGVKKKLRRMKSKLFGVTRAARRMSDLVTFNKGVATEDAILQKEGFGEIGKRGHVHEVAMTEEEILHDLAKDRIAHMWPWIMRGRGVAKMMRIDECKGILVAFYGFLNQLFQEHSVYISQRPDDGGGGDSSSSNSGGGGGSNGRGARGTLQFNEFKHLCEIMNVCDAGRCNKALASVFKVRRSEQKWWDGGKYPTVYNTNERIQSRWVEVCIETPCVSVNVKCYKPDP